MPVLSGRIITPSSSDPMALVAVYNGEIVSYGGPEGSHMQIKNVAVN